VLGEKGLTLPVGFSMRQVYVRYADIERINKKSLGANRALGNNAFSNQVVRSLTVLQLIHRGGKVVIVVEMLKSRADVDLIIRTCETRRGPAHKPLILPPVNFRF